MARNVEIKARARDFARQTRLVKALATAGPEHLEQRDVFFRVPNGRLKLRYLAPDRGELIAYERPDQTGPKTSSYDICPSDTPGLLETVLTRSAGVIGVVAKRRTVYFYENVRIHLDVVEGLGSFLELEVVLAADDDPASGRELAEALMASLDIGSADLIDCAYIDLLMGG